MPDSTASEAQLLFGASTHDIHIKADIEVPETTLLKLTHLIGDEVCNNDLDYRPF